LGKEELSELVMKSLNFRTGKMTAAEYYNYLKKVVEKYSNSVSTAEYPNLFAYIDYVNVHYTMDKNLLFDECAEVEGKIADALCKNELQKRLFTLSKHVGIYERMFKLELVKDDYRYYKAHKQDFKIQTFLDFIKVQAPANGITFTEDPGLSKIDSNLPIIEEFYEVAILRDPVLINNTIEEMNKEGATVCVMTTGGFHTKGLTEILKEKNVAYAVISPKITKQPEYNPYIDVMTNKKTPFEEFLDQLGSEEE
jgi:hypothetical protein